MLCSAFYAFFFFYGAVPYWWHPDLLLAPNQSEHTRTCTNHFSRIFFSHILPIDEIDLKAAGTT